MRHDWRCPIWTVCQSRNSLIVSKALLLAEDARITDETILFQIRQEKHGRTP